MTYLLQFTNPWGEKFFFCNLGNQWPYAPERRLIAVTSRHVEEAKVFETEEVAREVLTTAGTPTSWEVVEAAG